MILEITRCPVYYNETDMRMAFYSRPVSYIVEVKEAEGLLYSDVFGRAGFAF
jgi:hypothetical protein